jgi:homoserine dehydrogenase
MQYIAFAGAGTIGAPFLRLIEESQANKDADGQPFVKVKTVLVRDLSKKRSGIPAGIRLTDRAADILEDPEIKTVVELMGGVEGAFGFASAALRAGKNLVTANKNLLAEKGPELFALARDRGLSIGFEAAVCAGMPIIRALQESLRADSISSVEGILNGTTNYILTRMTEDALSYADALREAQRLSLAEPDPHNDVSGIDSACKLGILAGLAFGHPITPGSFPVAGIEDLDVEDLRQAKRMGYAIKLLGSARSDAAGKLDAEVSPALLPEGHPLASVRNEFNAVLVDSRGLGPNLFMGRGAGPDPTSTSLLTDLLDAARGRAAPVGADHAFLKPGTAPGSSEKSVARYYMRLSVPDRPGVLAQVSGLYAASGISIASVLQSETRASSGREIVPLILTTHTAERSRMKALLAALGTETWGKPVLLRIIED